MSTSLKRSVSINACTPEQKKLLRALLGDQEENSEEISEKDLKKLRELMREEEEEEEAPPPRSKRGNNKKGRRNEETDEEAEAASSSTRSNKQIQQLAKRQGNNERIMEAMSQELASSTIEITPSAKLTQEEYNRHVATLKTWCSQDFPKSIVGWKRAAGISGGSRTILTLVDEQL
eukprot:11545708-Prorocentrum_lima.AAC.1